VAYLTGACTHHKFAVSRHREDTAALPFFVFLRADIHVAAHEVGQSAGSRFKRQAADGKVDEGCEDAERRSALQFAVVVVAESLVEVDALTLIGGFAVAPEGFVDLREAFTHHRMLDNFERLELVDFLNRHLEVAHD
jgi:hypothetical protein